LDDSLFNPIDYYGTIINYGCVWIKKIALFLEQLVILGYDKIQISISPLRIVHISAILLVKGSLTIDLQINMKIILKIEKNL
jgi:hypothetical protein